MKLFSTKLSTGTLLALLAFSCGGSSNSSPTQITPGTLTVRTENPPTGNLSIVYTSNDKEFYPITPGVPVEGLAPGSYFICAQSQIRNTTELYIPYWTRTEVKIHSNENAQGHVFYNRQHLASGSIEYHISGFPSGASPQIGRFLTIAAQDNAWITESITPDQAVVTVPTAAGDWNIGGHVQGVNGVMYKATPSPSTIHVISGQTAVVTLAYSIMP